MTGYPGVGRAVRHLLGGGPARQYAILADQPLSAVAVNEAKDRLVFALADGRTVSYTAEGDCCSSTWIEHLTVPPDIAGAVVTAVGDYPIDGPDGADEYEVLKSYQTAFATTKGEIVVEYRNSSNGYYGGYLSGPEVTP